MSSPYYVEYNAFSLSQRLKARIEYISRMIEDQTETLIDKMVADAAEPTWWGLKMGRTLSREDAREMLHTSQPHWTLQGKISKLRKLKLLKTIVDDTKGTSSSRIYLSDDQIRLFVDEPPEPTKRKSARPFIT
jgi:hypothetical protein